MEYFQLKEVSILHFITASYSRQTTVASVVQMMTRDGSCLTMAMAVTLSCFCLRHLQQCDPCEPLFPPACLDQFVEPAFLSLQTPPLALKRPSSLLE